MTIVQASETRIRVATSEDAAVLGAYGAQLMALHHQWDPKRFISSNDKTPQSYARYLSSQLGKDDVLVIVAEEGDAIVGYCYGAIEGYDYMALRGPAGVLHDLFVDPRKRRCGLGRALIEAAVDALAQRGATQIVLSTAYQNEVGKRLFAAAGFQPTMVEMTRQLDPRTP